MKLREFVSAGRTCLLFGLVALTPSLLHAQDNFFTRWQKRSAATLAKQPKWMVPVISPYPTLIQVFRTDFTRQISPTHVTTWNYGTSRGLNLIPFARTEFDVYTPPFFEHSDGTRDGFGDWSVSAKYRIASGNEQHGNYTIAAQVVASVPTGSYKNGSLDASINPTLTGGKGWGKFDIATCIGGTLPTGDTHTLGRSLASNTYAQYHVAKYLWPELEMNTTAFFDGPRDGKVQTFLSPGLMTGKFALHPSDPKRRPGVAVGAAFQVAATTFHTYNHALAFTGRFIF